MKPFFTALLLFALAVQAGAQRYYEVGVKASRERISFLNLSRVAALPVRSQDLNMGMQVIHHVNKRLAFLGCAQYDTHRYFGQYTQSTNDFNVAMLQMQSVEVMVGVMFKFMTLAKFHPIATVGVSQYLSTTTEFPDSYAINHLPFVDELPKLEPRFYNLALNATPGFRYHLHEYLSVDLEPIFKWFIIGNTNYTDQLALGWSIGLNYKIGK